MSMSMYIVGIRKADATWLKMRAVYDACMEAKVEIPESVDHYFGGLPPDIRGVTVDLKIGGTSAVQPWTDDRLAADGFEIELSKLPKDLTHLRFYNSW